MTFYKKKKYFEIIIKIFRSDDNFVDIVQLNALIKLIQKCLLKTAHVMKLSLMCRYRNLRCSWVTRGGHGDGLVTLFYVTPSSYNRAQVKSSLEGSLNIKKLIDKYVVY